MRNMSRSRALARRAALLCSVSIAIAGNLGRAFGGVIDYPDGSNNASPIVLTDNSTQLQVLTGSGTQSGTISESGGSYGVEKIGAGTLTLTGNNTYTGGTTISAGVFKVGFAAGSLAPTGAVVVNAGTLELPGQTIGALSGSGGTILIDGGTLITDTSQDTFLAANIAGTGYLTKAGTGTLVFTGTATNTGYVAISGGVLQIGNGGTSGSLSNLIVNNASLIFDRSDTYVYGGSILSGTGSLTQAGSGKTILAGDMLTYTGETIIAAGTLQIGNGNSGSFVTGNILDNGALIFSRIGNGSYTGAISGAGTFIQMGPGQVILTNDNLYTGGTTIVAGTLSLGGGGTTGSILGNVVDDGALNFNHSNTVTFSGAVTGSGSLQQSGSGTLILTGSTSFTGGTTISSGILQLGTAGSLPSGGAVTIAGGTLDLNGHDQTVGALSGTGGNILLGTGTLTTNSSSSTVLTGAISGSGKLVMAGTGTLTLNAATSAAGGIVIQNGTLKLGTFGAFANTQTFEIDGGTFDFNSRVQTIGAIAGTGGTLIATGQITTNTASDTTLASIISGNGEIYKSGSGTLTLTGTSSFTGFLSAMGGTVTVNGSLPSATIVVINGGSLSGIGSVGAVSLQSGGVLRPGNRSAAPESGNASGTLTVNGNLTLVPDSTYDSAFAYSTASGWTFDKTMVTGTAIVAGNLSVNFPGYGGIYSRPATYTLIQSTGALSGSFSDINVQGLAGSGNHVSGISYDANDVYLNVVRDTFTWSANPVSSDWSQVGNWQNGAVPLWDVAYFGATNQSSITMIGNLSGGNVQSLQFNADAPAYNFTIAASSSPVPSDYIIPPPCTGYCSINPQDSLLVLENGITNLSSNAPTFMVGGVFGDSQLSFTNSGNAADAIIIVGALGTASFHGISDAGSDASLTALRLGTIDFSQTSGPNGDGRVSAGSIAGPGSFILGANALTVGALGTSTEVSGVISGEGELVKVGSGTLTLSGTNTYFGGTTISDGVLELGNGGTAGSILGNVVDNALLAFNRSDNIAYSGTISGAGTLAQSGTGSTTLSAANTYTGPTTVSAGTLNITGSIASSSVTVASGGTLAGTGKTGPVTVASGGTLSPGTNSGAGALIIQGNLSLASGATTLDSITPGSNSNAQITGTASLAGALTASAASGTYAVGQRYTLLNAASGISGTYASLTTPGLPFYVKGRLGYDADDVYLYLDANAITPLLGASVTGNEKNVAGGIDAAIKGGTNLSGGFLSLFGLSGSALNGALDQLSGQVANSAFGAANQSFTPFLSLLTDISGEAGSGPATQFAPQASYDTPGAPHPAQASGTIRTWATIFGGHTALSGDAATGAHDLSSGVAGFAAGVETQIDDVSLLGASLAVGHESFSSGDGQGGSDDVMLAAYGRHTLFGRGYLSGALGYGWHDVSTRRLVTVSGTDLLTADFGGHDLGGRIEAGYGLALDDGSSLIPYAAFAGQEFHAPAYGEKAASGSSTFALSYAANTADAAHTEFGSHYQSSFATPDGRIISLDATGAWEHELNDNPLVQAAFEALPGSGFTVYGTRPATDTALLGLGLHTKQDDALTFGVHGDARIGTGTTILTGTLDLLWRS